MLRFGERIPPQYWRKHKPGDSPEWDEERFEALVPSHIREPIRQYVMRGILPGDFLTAVLRNDLTAAITRADSTNRAALYEIVMFLLNYVPWAAWGTAERISTWISQGGWEGYVRQQEEEAEAGDVEV